MSSATWTDRVIAATGWLVVVFLLFPVLFTAVVSFGASPFITFPPESWSWRWYANIAEIHRVGTSTLISLMIAALAALAAVVLGIGIALVLVRMEIAGKAALTAFITSPVAVPIVAIGIALIQFFIWLGIEFTWYSLMIGHLVLVIAYPVRTLVASLSLSNPSLEEAAASLGADPWRVFFTVTLPQMKPGLISGFLFAFLISFDNYPISIFLVRGELTTLPIEVFNYISNNFDPTPAAFSTLYVLVLTAVILWAERRYAIVSLSVASGATDGRRRA
ncbi:MAG: ABC transporter permease [Burkholderiales bacterium]|nr:MAG: ABC transporter permease [Burkholderiales bacterium]